MLNCQSLFDSWSELLYVRCNLHMFNFFDICKAIMRHALKKIETADSTSQNVVPESVPAARAPSPVRRSMTRMSSRERRSYQPLALGSLASGTSDRFSDAMELQTRATSVATSKNIVFFSIRLSNYQIKNQIFINSASNRISDRFGPLCSK